MILMVFKSLSLFGRGIVWNLREPKNPRAGRCQVVNRSRARARGKFSLKQPSLKNYFKLTHYRGFDPTS